MPAQKTKLPARFLGRDAEILSLAQAAWRMAKTRRFTYEELMHSVAILHHCISRASGIPLLELSARVAEKANRIAIAVKKQPTE